LECKSSERNEEAQEEVTIDVMIPKIKMFKYMDWSCKAMKVSMMTLASRYGTGMTKREAYVYSVML